MDAWYKKFPFDDRVFMDGDQKHQFLFVPTPFGILCFERDASR